MDRKLWKYLGEPSQYFEQRYYSKKAWSVIMMCLFSDIIQKYNNHPVHIIDMEGNLSPSAFIPFCEFGGNMSIMGIYGHIYWICYNSIVSLSPFIYYGKLKRYSFTFHQPENFLGNIHYCFISSFPCRNHDSVKC